MHNSFAMKETVLLFLNAALRLLSIHSESVMAHIKVAQSHAAKTSGPALKMYSGCYLGTNTKIRVNKSNLLGHKLNTNRAQKDIFLSISHVYHCTLWLGAFFRGCLIYSDTSVIDCHCRQNTRLDD